MTLIENSRNRATLNTMIESSPPSKTPSTHVYSESSLCKASDCQSETCPNPLFEIVSDFFSMLGRKCMWVIEKISCCLNHNESAVPSEISEDSNDPHRVEARQPPTSCPFSPANNHGFMDAASPHVSTVPASPQFASLIRTPVNLASPLALASPLSPNFQPALPLGEGRVVSPPARRTLFPSAATHFTPIKGTGAEEGPSPTLEVTIRQGRSRTPSPTLSVASGSSAATSSSPSPMSIELESSSAIAVDTKKDRELALNIMKELESFRICDPDYLKSVGKQIDRRDEEAAKLNFNFVKRLARANGNSYHADKKAIIQLGRFVIGSDKRFAGNSEHLAAATLVKAILHPEWTSKLELVGTPKNAFVIVGREDDSDLNDSSTWGPDAFIMDGWWGSVMRSKVWRDGVGKCGIIKYDELDDRPYQQGVTLHQTWTPQEIRTERAILTA
jgi:hypothetical protein